MCKKNLIWVVTRMQVVVDRYPTWGDVVQVDTWVSASGTNGMRCDWLLRDIRTGEILTRASSVWVMMNKLTRKLSKMPEEVRGEIEPYFVNTDPVVQEDNRKVPKLDDTADYIHTGLSLRWSDLDVNQHVNNVKYIGWILEPQHLLRRNKLQKLCDRYQDKMYVFEAYEGLKTVETLDQQVIFIPKKVKDVYLLHILSTMGDKKIRSAIVFVSTCSL